MRCMKKVEWERQFPTLNQKTCQLQRKRKKERKIVENYFANTMACFSLAQFNKSREKLLLNTLTEFYTVRLANNVTRALYRKCPIFVCDVAFSQRNWQTTVESSLKASFNFTILLIRIKQNVRIVCVAEGVERLNLTKTTYCY